MPTARLPGLSAESTDSDFSGELSEGEGPGREAPENFLDPLPPAIGPYRVLQKLGRGGQGLVLLVQDPSAQQPLALKILTTASRGSLLRFRREFQAVRQLAHPNVVRVFESGFYEGFPYFTMELIEGMNLRTLVWRSWGGPGTPALAGRIGQLLELTADVVDALGYIHSRRLVHRDLKPDNIMVTGETTAKLMDFGLAKDLNDPGSGTMVGTMLGTAAYMAPEQILGRQELDGRTDYYALGVTLYEIVTGSWPFVGDSDWTILQRHLNEDPRPPRQISPWLDVEVERFILALMAREPQNRPSSAQEILARLDPLLARGRHEPLPLSVAPTDLLVPALVGHEDLERWLGQMLQTVSAGNSGPQVAFVSGRSGFGKSRLLDSVEEWSRRKLLTVRRASCRKEKCSPFSAFTTLIESLSVFWFSLSDEQRRELAPVAALVPSLAPRGSAAQTDARHAFQAMLRLLELALEQKPLVFLVDDVHWADELSFDFLKTLARLPTTLPLIIVTTYRPEEISAPLSHILESDPSSEVYLRRELRPFSRQQLAALAGSSMGVRPEAIADELLALLSTAAQGSPLLALQTLQRLVSEGWVRRVDDHVFLAHTRAPASGPGILGRTGIPLSSIEDLEEEILDLCAVFGPGLSMDLLSGLIVAEEARLLNALNRLIQRRVLRAIRTDEAFELAQHTVRDKVYARIPEERRRELHGRVARTLQASMQDLEPWLEALAYHFRAAGQVEDALLFLDRSVKKCLRLYAYRDAVRLSREALELMESITMTPPRWAQKNKFLTDQSQAWYRLGDIEEALASSRLALEAARGAGSPRMEVGAENNFGLLYTALRQFDKAKGHFEIALRLLREHQVADLEPYVLNNLGNLQIRQGHGEQAWEQVQRALETANRLGDEPLQVVALLNLTELELKSGRLGEARQRLGQLQAKLGLPGFEAQGVLARVLQGLGWRSVGQWSRAEQLWREALEAARKLSETRYLQRTLLELAELEVDRGRLDAAQAWLADLEQDEQALQQPNFRLRLRRLGAEIQLARCAWAEALKGFEEMQSSARLEDPVEGLAVFLSYGKALGELGQFNEAAAALERVEKEAEALGIEPLLMEARFAKLFLLLESSRATQEHFAQMGTLEAEAEERGERLWVRRIQLWELVVLGDAESSRWHEACEAFRRETAMVDLVQAVLMRAETYLKAGQLEPAAKLLRERSTEVLGLGMPWYELVYSSLRAAVDTTPAGTEFAMRTLGQLRDLGNRLREQDRNAFIMRPAVQAIRRRLAGGR